MLISCALYNFISIVMFPPLCSTTNYLDNFKLPTGSKITSNFLYQRVKSFKTVAIYYEDDESKFLTINEKLANILINTFKNNHSYYLIKNNITKSLEVEGDLVNIYIIDESYLESANSTYIFSVNNDSIIMNIVIVVSNDSLYCTDHFIKQFYTKYVDKISLIVQYCQFDIHGAFRFVYKSKVENNFTESIHKIEVDLNLEDNFKSIVRSESIRFVDQNVDEILESTTNDVLNSNILKQILHTRSSYQNYTNKIRMLNELSEGKKFDSVLLQNTKNSEYVFQKNIQYSFPIELKDCSDWVDCKKFSNYKQSSHLLYIIFAVGLAFLVRMSSKIVWALEVVTYTKKLTHDKDDKKKWFDLDMVMLYSIFVRQPVKIKLSTMAQMLFVSSVLFTSLICYGYFYSTMLKVSQVKVKILKNQCVGSNRFVEDYNPDFYPFTNGTSLMYAFRKNSPHFRGVNKNILRLIESGLIDKSNKEQCMKNSVIRFKKNSNKDISFSLRDYRDAFAILFAGLLFSVSMFLYQILITKYYEK